MAEEKVAAKYVLRAIPDKCYEEAIEAKARGEMIGWSASNFPQEITTTLGIPIVYPESQAAQIAANGGVAASQDDVEILPSTEYHGETEDEMDDDDSFGGTMDGFIPKGTPLPDE